MENEEIRKSYYAIIPANVRYDKNLTPNAKLLYGEITALCNEKGYCWATNKYFSDLYGVSKVTISIWIKSLSDNGYIECEIVYKEGTKEILGRYIRIVKDPIKENFNTYLKNSKYPIKENFTYNNTIENNTNNITLNNTNNIYIHEIVDYLNTVCGTSYKASTDKTRKLINARLNEGFTVDDFKIVIDKKSKEWLGTDYAKYLRPETLFGTKFESYLNALSSHIAYNGGKANTMDMLESLYCKYEDEENETD